MFVHTWSASRRHCAALVALIWVATLSPLAASAAEWIAPGTVVAVTSTEPVLLRAGPGYDAESLSEVAGGAQVTIIDGPITAADGSAWYQVDLWGQAGFLPDYAIAAPVVDASVAAEVAAEPAPVEAPPADPAVVAEPALAGAPIGTILIAFTNGDGAICRAAPSYDGAAVTVLPEGTLVDVTGDAIGEWQPVNCAGVGGYVNVSFISWDLTVATTTAPTDEAAVMADEQGRGKRDRNGGGAVSSTGQAVADFASQYQGYPYIYAGEGPYSFDCSGLTKFVVMNVTGMDISHDMATQINMGTPVDRSALQPGDLVFFQNTFKPGLSHAGIYIGSGQFIHAENESTGVRVSDINDDYYSSRWYGAVRYW